MRNNNHNKIVVITGASGGIGRVISIVFAKANYDLVLISNSKEELNKLKKDLNSFDNRKTFISVDVSDRNAVIKKMKTTKTVDVLINAAGVQGPIGNFISNSYQKWLATININLIGTVNMAMCVIPKMIGGCSIINFAGGGALTPRQNFSAYAVAKTGVVRFSEILAEELKERKIRVNSVSPGAVNTNMFKEMLKAGIGKVGKKEWEKLMSQKSDGGENPINAAELCLWLASSKSKPITGKTISAVYDNWRKWDKKHIKAVALSDWYSLRRFDPYSIDKLPKI